SGSRRFYFFTVPAGQTLKWSVVLAWHRVVVPDATWQDAETRLPNLDLVLWEADADSVPRQEVARSASTIDNVEHLYRKALPAGRYALEVVSPVADVPYGLA